MSIDVNLDSTTLSPSFNFLLLPPFPTSPNASWWIAIADQIILWAKFKVLARFRRDVLLSSLRLLLQSSITRIWLKIIDAILLLPGTPQRPTEATRTLCFNSFMLPEGDGERDGRGSVGGASCPLALVSKTHRVQEKEKENRESKQERKSESLRDILLVRHAI